MKILNIIERKRRSVIRYFRSKKINTVLRLMELVLGMLMAQYFAPFIQSSNGVHTQNNLYGIL